MMSLVGADKEVGTQSDERQIVLQRFQIIICNSIKNITKDYS